MKSKAVKNALFDMLNQDNRFVGTMQKVIGHLKRGQEPVILESWRSYFRNLKPTDEDWKWLLSESDFQHFHQYWDDKDVDIKSRVCVYPMQEGPVRDITVTINVTKRDKILFVSKVQVPQVFVDSHIIYFGARDYTYFKVYCEMLGYKIAEGNLGGKQGILISFGDE